MTVQQRERYPAYDELCIGYLTVRECRDCGAVVGDKDKHDAYHEFLSRLMMAASA